MIPAEDLGGLLFHYHTHAEIAYDEDPEQIVYTEADVIELLKKFGFPEPVWGKHINPEDYEFNPDQEKAS